MFTAATITAAIALIREAPEAIDAVHSWFATPGATDADIAAKLGEYKAARAATSQSVADAHARVEAADAD